MFLKTHRENPYTTFQKSMPYQHSQLFRGNTKLTFNQYHHAEQVVSALYFKVFFTFFF